MDRVWWTGKQLVVMDITELLENSVVKKIKQEQGERRACVCKRRAGKLFVVQTLEDGRGQLQK